MIQNIENQQQPVEAMRQTRYRKGKVVPKSDSISLNITKQSKSTMELNRSTQIQQKQCRVCLESHESRQNQIIAPCNCIGSCKYIHEDCFKKWVQHQFTQKNKDQKKKILNDGIKCEICKESMGYKFSYEDRCVNCQSLKKKFQQNKTVFLLFIVFLVINLGCTAFLAYYSISTNLSIDKNLVEALMILLGFAFLAITLFLLCYFFIDDNMFDKKLVLEKSTQKPKPSKSKRYLQNRINPENAIEQIE